MTDEQAIANANRASTDLAIVGPIFEQMRAALIDRWAATAAVDTATREKMFNAYATINTVEKALNEAVAAGEFSKVRLRAAEMLAPAR